LKKNCAGKIRVSEERMTGRVPEILPILIIGFPLNAPNADVFKMGF
jgi:hypothetical protein